MYLLVQCWIQVYSHIQWKSLIEQGLERKTYLSVARKGKGKKKRNGTESLCYLHGRSEGGNAESRHPPFPPVPPVGTVNLKLQLPSARARGCPAAAGAAGPAQRPERRRQRRHCPQLRCLGAARVGPRDTRPSLAQPVPSLPRPAARRAGFGRAFLGRRRRDAPPSPQDGGSVGGKFG